MKKQIVITLCCLLPLAGIAKAQAKPAERTADEKVWDLYQTTKDWPIEKFNRALDLLDDTERTAVPSNFKKTNPDDKDLAILSGYWSDQIAAAAVLVASSKPDGGTIHLGEGPVAFHHGEFGQSPTMNDELDAYARTRPDGIWPGVHDPTPALFENGYYYVFATAEGMPMFRSKDRIHWRHIGSAFPKGQQPAWWNQYQPANVKKDKDNTLLSCEYNPNVFVWAPHLFRYHGQYQLYYAIPSTLGKFRFAAIGLATKSTLDPSVPWQDQGMIINCNDSDIFNTIDPAFLVDREGNAWMPFGSFSPGGIEIVPLDNDTLHVKAGAHKPWTQLAGDGMEAPTVIFDKKSDRYYLFTSEGFGIGRPWDYKVRVYRTEPGAPVTGPYLDQDGRRALDATNQIGRGDKNDNPGYILLGAEGDRVAPGGESIYTDDVDGKQYMIFHERDNSRWINAPGIGPLPVFNLQIRELTFNDAGWPVLGPPTMKTPDPTTVKRPAVPPGNMKY